MSAPRSATTHAIVQPGIVALPEGLLWLEGARALVVADAHFAYEEVIGGALPLWSTDDALSLLESTAIRLDAREFIFLGDVIHASRMSAGAAKQVGALIERLRERWIVSLVAGNHEGRTHGYAVLGQTLASVERDGWLLLHGDACDALYERRIVGHLHPSIALGAGASVPAFLASPRLIVVPALTPYSPGLNVLSSACSRALRALGGDPGDFAVFAADRSRVYPFGALTALRSAVRGHASSRFARRRLRAD